MFSPQTSLLNVILLSSSHRYSSSLCSLPYTWALSPCPFSRFFLSPHPVYEHKIFFIFCLALLLRRKLKFYLALPPLIQRMMSPSLLPPSMNVSSLHVLLLLRFLASWFFFINILIKHILDVCPKDEWFLGLTFGLSRKLCCLSIRHLLRMESLYQMLCMD